MDKFLMDCAHAMNAYRQLTNDRTYASRTDSGRMQLVRITYGDTGASHIEECSDWIPVNEWLEYIRSISI